MRDAIRVRFVILFSLALLFPRGAHAGDPAPWPQPLFSEPPISSSGGIFLEGTAAAPRWAWYSKADVRWAYGAGVSNEAHQTRGDFVFGLGLPGRLEAALALPVGFTAGTHTFRDGAFRLEGMGDDGFGLGDLRAALLWNAMSAESGGFALSFGFTGYAPTGKHARLLGEGGFACEAYAAASLELLGAKLSLNLGYRVRPEHILPGEEDPFEQDDDVFWRVGVRVPRKNDIAWSIEAAGAVGVLTAEGPWPSAGSRPVWIGGGIDFPVGRRNRLGMIAGGGIGEAAPVFTVSLRLSTAPVAPDEDGDGLSGGSDDCPLFPEDVDGFNDDDGCPDMDNDADGFPDDEDACPKEPAASTSEDGC